LPVAELVNGVRLAAVPHRLYLNSQRTSPAGTCFALLTTYSIFSFDSESLMKGRRPNLYGYET
jgi:hypothetical protein